MIIHEDKLNWDRQADRQTDRQRDRQTEGTVPVSVQ